jgi:hypothetical protein
MPNMPILTTICQIQVATHIHIPSLRPTSEERQNQSGEPVPPDQLIYFSCDILPLAHPSGLLVA